MANVLFRQKLTLAAASQPASDLPVGRRLRRPVQPRFEKYFAFHSAWRSTQIRDFLPRIPSR